MPSNLTEVENFNQNSEQHVGAELSDLDKLSPSSQSNVNDSDIQVGKKKKNKEVKFENESVSDKNEPRGNSSLSLNSLEGLNIEHSDKFFIKSATKAKHKKHQRHNTIKKNESAEQFRDRLEARRNYLDYIFNSTLPEEIKDEYRINKIATKENDTLVTAVEKNKADEPIKAEQVASVLELHEKNYQIYMKQIKRHIGKSNEIQNDGTIKSIFSRIFCCWKKNKRVGIVNNEVVHQKPEVITDEHMSNFDLLIQKHQEHLKSFNKKIAMMNETKDDNEHQDLNELKRVKELKSFIELERLLRKHELFNNLLEKNNAEKI